MEKAIENLNQLSNAIATDENVKLAFQNNPEEAIQKVLAQAPNPLKDDYWIYRVIVLSLGLTVLFIVIGILTLMLKKNVSDQQYLTLLTALGSAAIGAIAGLLAPPPGNTNSN